MPLIGIPDYRGSKGTLNEAVLETKSRLNDDPKLNAAVYAFGSLDNRELTGGRWDTRAQVAAMAEAGFDGLKLWEGKPEMAAALKLKTDDPGITEACLEAGRLGMPVIYHVADPPEFWDRKVGSLSLSEKDVPGFDELIRGASALCEKAPETTIVFPHLCFLAADLQRAGGFLDRTPNACFDLAPGNYFYLPLSRNPGSAGEFFSRYRNRILFGTDSFFFSEGDALFPGDSLEGNRRRCLRLRSFLRDGFDEQGMVDNPYPLSRGDFPTVDCLNLPEDVLQDILSGNARRILPEFPGKVRR